MVLAKDYDSVMGRANEIMKKALGLDYQEFESGSIAFDYEALMKSTNYTLEEVAKIQAKTAVGNTPLIELRNLSTLSRKYAKPGYGARILQRTKRLMFLEVLRQEDSLRSCSRKEVRIQRSYRSYFR